MSRQLNMMPEFPRMFTPVVPTLLPLSKPKETTVQFTFKDVPVREAVFSMTKATIPTYAHLMTKLYTLDAIIIPTNYRCVMGRGLARQMNRVFPGLDKMFLQITGKDATCVKGVMAPRPKVLHRAYLKPLHGKRKGLTAHHRRNPKFAKPKLALVYFPVKDDWMNNASIDIIRESVGKFKAWLEARPQFTTVGLPRVGCGNGKLKWEIVRPALYPLLRMEQVQLYDYAQSTPIMTRDLLYDWIGSAQPHYRGNAEYEHLPGEKERAVDDAKRTLRQGRLDIYHQEQKFCSTMGSYMSKYCGYTGWFDGNIIPNCISCQFRIRKARHLRKLKAELEMAINAKKEFDAVWAKVEMNKIMKDHPEYKHNNLKRCTKVLMHMGDREPSRSQKNYARLHIRAKEVRIIYCAELRTKWGQPEIVDVIKHYLSYGSKVTVYDYREPEAKAYSGRAFLKEFYPDDTPDYINKLVETTQKRLRVANYLKDFDYNDYPRPATVNTDDHTFVERHGHATDFNKNEYDYIRSTALIPNVMSDKEIDHWLIQEAYMKAVVIKSTSNRIKIKVTPLPDLLPSREIYAEHIVDGHVIRTYHHISARRNPNVIRFKIEEVNYGFTSGRELDHELFAGDINPDWCYSTDVGTASLEGEAESYGGDIYVDDVE